MITTIITLAIIFYLFYYLFIKGNIWPILLVIFGVLGGRQLILNWFPHSSYTIITFMSYHISYATFIAAIISILGIGIIMEKAK